MPTLLREAGWRVYFYSHEPNEPPHVHADRGGGSAKIWLTPVRVASSLGLSSHDLADILRLIRRHSDDLVEAWYGYFGAQDR